MLEREDAWGRRWSCVSETLPALRVAPRLLLPTMTFAIKRGSVPGAHAVTGIPYHVWPVYHPIQMAVHRLETRKPVVQCTTTTMHALSVRTYRITLWPGSKIVARHSIIHQDNPHRILHAPRHPKHPPPRQRPVFRRSSVPLHYRSKTVIKPSGKK
jgi:hypothetical protein